MSLRVDEILHVEKSQYQDVLVFKNKQQGNVLVLDGAIQCSEKDEFRWVQCSVSPCSLYGTLLGSVSIGWEFHSKVLGSLFICSRRSIRFLSTHACLKFDRYPHALFRNPTRTSTVAHLSPSRLLQLPRNDRPHPTLDAP